MRSGSRTQQPQATIDYKALRKVNAEAARKAVLEYLKTQSSISRTARMFGITRAVVYDILTKEELALEPVERFAQRCPP